MKFRDSYKCNLPISDPRCSTPLCVDALIKPADSASVAILSGSSPRRTDTTKIIRMNTITINTSRMTPTISPAINGQSMGAELISLEGFEGVAVNPFLDRITLVLSLSTSDVEKGAEEEVVEGNKVREGIREILIDISIEVDMLS